MGKHAFNTVMTRIFVTVVLLLQSSLWTRMLAPEGRGLYAKLQTTQNFLVLFLGFGMTSGIVYFCSSQKARPSQLWTLSLLISFLGTLVTGVLILFGHLWPSLDLIFPAGYEGFFFTVYFLAFFIQSQLQLTMNSFLAAEHQFKQLNYLEIMSTVLRFFLISVAYFFRDRLVLEILFAIDLVAHTIKTGLFVKYFRQLETKFHLTKITWIDTKPILKYSFALYALYVIQYLYQRVDVWIIEHWCGLTALGIFSCAVGLAQYLTILPIALNTVLTPHMSQSTPEEAYTNLALFSRVNFTLLLLPVLIFTLFPEQILILIFGKDFAIGTTSLRILAIAYWATAAKHIFIYFSASQNRLKINFYIESFGLFIGLLLNFLWIPIYGIDGAAYAFLATGLITGGLSFVSIQSFSKVKQKNFFAMNLADIQYLKRSILNQKV